MGCNSDNKGWDAPVLSHAENHSPLTERAEVITDHCGALRSSCTSVRLLDETGYANAQGGRLFTYRGKPKLITVSWKDENTLQVNCQSCDLKKIDRQLQKVNFTYIEYAF
jgi:hypothetical protein